MENENLIAKVSVDINAPVNKVWEALIDPDIIKKYMFGTSVVSDWKEGSEIIWKGEWKGKTYEDKGKILLLVPEKKLQYSHFSPMEGKPDNPDNYHIITFQLTKEGQLTTIELTQDKNVTEEAREHSETNWKMVMESMKKVLEENVLE